VPEADVARPAVIGAAGRATIEKDALRLMDVRGEEGTRAEIAVLLPAGVEIRSVTVNGVAIPAPRRSGDVVSFEIAFAGVRFEHCHQVGAYDPSFRGGPFRASFSIPRRVFDQLRARRREWPIPYDEEDLLATWLGSDRLLLFAQVADPKDEWTVGMSIDGKPIEVRKAYGAVYPQARERTFLGFYANVSRLEPDATHTIEVALPELAPGQFQGLFFENVEAALTEGIRVASVNAR